MITRLKIFLLVLVLILLMYNIYNFFNISVSKNVFKSSLVPKSFDGFRIVQISDFHNKKFHRREFFIKTVISQRPDVIFLTGDFLDSRTPDFEYGLKVIEEFAPIIKMYYVIGNHEGRISNIDKFLKRCEELGVTILRNESVKLEKGDSHINIVGVDDPEIGGIKNLINALENLKEEGHLNILLSHRPEIYKEYARAGYDLVFTGHTHGGQIRLPFLGALFVPDQGVFPKYDKGVYREKNTTMVVSSGIGTSVVPIRIFNRPEIVLMELKNII